MRLLLINPSNRKRSLSDLKIAAQLVGKKALSMPLALPTLAALTPPDVDVTLVDEEIESIDFETDADLIGITALTNSANRAYEIADEFRKRGRHVVMGGIHASMLPEEALTHVDTVVIGEAEGIWDRVIEDFRNGKIQQKYKADAFVDLNDYPVARRDLLKNDQYAVHLVQTKRGCPYKCTFCSVQKFNGRKVRIIGAEKVRKELEQIISIHKSLKTDYGIKFTLRDSEGKPYEDFLNIFITDDNFIINKQHVGEICSVLMELSRIHKIKIIWSTQADINVAKDDELLQLMADAGCNRLFIGFESLSNENLAQMNKNCKTSDEYGEAIRKIYSHGIDVIASFVIGNDFDDDSSLQNLPAFVQKNDLFDVLIGILTPYPGTDLFDEFEEDGRILSKDWSKYSFYKVVYSPKKVTFDALLNIYNGLLQSIYEKKAMVERLLKRDKEIFQNRNNLYFEPTPNKLLFIMMLNLKSLLILMRSGMAFKNVVKVIYLATQYLKRSDRRFSLLTVNGYIYFIDKAHYVLQSRN